MKKQFLAFLLSLLAVIPAFANPRQPVGWSKGHDGRYQYLDFSESNVPAPSAATAAVGQIVSITQEVVVDFQCLPNPGNPSPGNVRLYCDSGTGNLTCLTSTGANCLGGGGGGGGGLSSIGLAGPTGIPITNSPLTANGTLTWAMPTGWILGDLLVGNGPNSVARLAAPTTPNSVPQVFMSTPSAGIGQIGAFALLGIAGRTVSGTTDTILATDRANSVEYTSNSAVAITVPDPASSSGFNQSPAFITINEGQGIDTFTPQTSAVITYCNGAICFANQPNVPLLPGQYATWSSPSTANWLVRISTTGSATATPLFNDQLLSGGGVVWTGGLNFTISAACYQIASTTYCSPQTNVTLTTADPTNPRIDAFIVDNTGTASVLTGTPAGSPSSPSVDPTSQLLLTIATVAANATTPTLNNILVYDENLTPPTEWTCTPSANFNCNSTNNPFHGSKDIEVTTAVAGNNVALVNNATVNLSTYAAFSFNIRNKANWPNQKSVSICFKNGSTVVGTCIAFKNGVFGFNQANLASYQQIVIPLSAFGLGSTVVDRVVFQVVGGNASIGFYLDFIQLQSAIGVGGGPNLQLQVDGQNTQSVANLQDSASVTFAKVDVGGVSTIKATAVGAPPSGTAGGDLSGTYPNPTVAAANGGAFPTSAHLIGTNGSKQPTTATQTDVNAIGYVAGGGTANAQTATLSPAIAAYSTGLQVCWKPSNANASTTPTLAVNGLTATTIIKVGGAALATNDLTTTAIACAIYDGTNFELQNPQTTTAGGVTSLTGDGSGYNNSASTGAVTLTKASQNPNLVAAGPTSSSSSNLVQKNSAVAVSGTTSTYSTTPTAGDLLIAITVNDSAHVNTVTGGGNTWTKATSSALNTVTTDVFYVCNAAGSATTVTPTWPGGTGIALLQIFEYSGNNTGSCLDVVGTAGSNSPGQSVTATTSGSVAQSTELVFGSCTALQAGNTTVSIPPTFSQLIGTASANTNQVSSQLNQSTGLSGTQSLTCTTAATSPADNNTIIATFKLNSSGSAVWTFRSLVTGDLPANTPGVVFASTTAGRTTAISDTVMTTTSAAGLYRFTATVNCTTTSAAAVAQLNLKYTDTANTAQTVSISDTCTSLVTSGVPSMVTALRVKAGTNITYGVAITNTPTYDVDVRLEQMN